MPVCIGCGTEIHYVRVKRYNSLCIPCNRDNVGITLVQTSSGFKNNGACLTTVQEHVNHMQTQHVRG